MRGEGHCAAESNAASLGLLWGGELYRRLYNHSTCKFSAKYDSVIRTDSPPLFQIFCTPYTTPRAARSMGFVGV